MTPDLEVVELQGNESFRVWYHGYPFRTVRWHYHPEYEIQLIAETSGKYFVGDFIGDFAPGNLVMTGPNLPHNWVSELPEGQTVERRGLIVQFPAEYISNGIAAFPELAHTQKLLAESQRGLVFCEHTAAAAKPIFEELLDAQGCRRIVLFLSLLDLLARCEHRQPLASEAYRADPGHYMSSTINQVLSYIGENLASDLPEADLAELAGQSVSAFSRYFRKHTGMSVVQCINRMRINRACELLASSEFTVTEICFLVGFNNVSNFNRHFLAQKSMSPSKFRSCQQLNAACLSAA
ncbi:AraC family transcriptional regulator [Jeongeupia chitinilytica]|uniref:AraC family transcriptional regulator n=1 Tax=Jeongeupia chitinilytica TaxID=1041641 RepID=A0ABQ3GU78_9NEIS|nr:AraC family transcriptional regulator [Jeongeupia chitinilytica]GHD55215.1 AraC family transcriptional regulator [Jeongeupia chitinilytica]